MHKNEYFTGQPVLSQILSLVNRSRINRIAKEFGSDHYYKKFKTYDHLVTLLYSVYHRCSSIREITTGLQACFSKINHLGMEYFPRKSTISDANKNRSAEVFERIFYDLYKQYRKILPDSSIQQKWYQRLFVVDSTTISLFQEILQTVGRHSLDGKRKGGIKVHTLIKADEDVPCFVRITKARKHDVHFIRGLKLPPKAIVVMDKAYIEYEQFKIWDDQDVCWVVRMKDTLTYKIVCNHPIDSSSKQLGVMQDQTVQLGNKQNNFNKMRARRISYYDSQSGKTLFFLTNNDQMEALQIAKIYQCRWQIELLFKRIKQNFPLRYFLGNNENAIKIQVWVVLIADLLLKIIKSNTKRRWAYSNLISMIRIHLMSYLDLRKFLEDPDGVIMKNKKYKELQPTLFDP